MAIAKSGKGPLEVALLTLARIAFLVLLLWVATHARAALADDARVTHRRRALS
jgi:hypothetical protein